MNNFMQMIQAAKNPQEFLNQAMNNSAVMQNPVARNAIDLYQKGDIEGLNKVAENLCKEKGISSHDAYNQVRKMFGL